MDISNWTLIWTSAVGAFMGVMVVGILAQMSK